MAVPASQVAIADRVPCQVSGSVCGLLSVVRGNCAPNRAVKCGIIANALCAQS